MDLVPNIVNLPWLSPSVNWMWNLVILLLIIMFCLAIITIIIYWIYCAYAVIRDRLGWWFIGRMQRKTQRMIDRSERRSRLSLEGLGGGSISEEPFMAPGERNDTETSVVKKKGIVRRNDSTDWSEFEAVDFDSRGKLK